jgi:GNAT superfamily N-acetyltransferase
LHRRGFNDSYLIRVDGGVVGYGTVTSGEDEHKVFQKGILNEFYLLPDYKSFAVAVFGQLLAASQAIRMQVQTNDTLSLLLLYDFAVRITPEAILFHDARTTGLSLPDGVFRRAAPSESEDGWLIEVAGNIVASGGFLTHYNPPYGDIYLGVAEPHRRRGYGSYLVQELKRVCYEAGRRPAARCNAANLASRKTLEKAGLLPCARILTGELSP